MTTLRSDTTKRQYILRLWQYCTETQIIPDQLIAEKEAALQNSAMRGASEDRLISWHSNCERRAPAVAVDVFTRDLIHFFPCSSSRFHPPSNEFAVA
ncbi:MAG: hypothetical protein JSV51_05165 [Candidatus Bathyarchaeota archaeon]|nr:MAG: hypothetical protein JSV51_05165 [Candidatus Bathyarchaeota archaeon]